MPACETIRHAVDALLDGRFEAISPEAMAAAEAHLNECPHCAARLEAALPASDSMLRAKLDVPRPDAWHAVWERIELETRPRQTAPTVYRFARTFSALAAAAVLLLAIGLLRFGPFSGGASEELRLAAAEDVQIESLEINGDEMPFVISAGEKENIPVIWFVQNEGA